MKIHHKNVFLSLILNMIRIHISTQFFFMSSASLQSFPSISFYLLKCIFKIIIIFGHTMWCRMLLPWPGIEPVPPALEVQSLKHWTAREVPQVFLFKFMYISLRSVYLFLYYPHVAVMLWQLTELGVLKWLFQRQARLNESQNLLD